MKDKSDHCSFFPLRLVKMDKNYGTSKKEMWTKILGRREYKLAILKKKKKKMYIDTYKASSHLDFCIADFLITKFQFHL